MSANSESTKISLVVFITLLGLILTLPWLDRPFYSRGEPREALVAQSMLATGNWISPPAYNGAVPSKPPFSHWLIGVSSLPGGEVTEVTSRLPSALAFVIFNVYFLSFLLKRVSTQNALFAVLILVSSAEWFRAAVSCRVDTILSASLAGALLSLYSWRERGRRGFPLLSASLIACAGLTKGPIGIALPLGIFSLFELVEGERSVRNLARVIARALIIAAPVIVVVSLWYIAGYAQRGDVFLDKIWYENVARLTSSMEDEPHKHSVFYLIGMLFLGLLPWALVWGAASVGGLSQARASIKALPSWWRESSELHRFAALSAGMIFLFFCVPSSKRSVYLLPAYPFIALVAAELLEKWRSASGRFLTTLSSVLTGVSLTLVAATVCVLIYPATPKLELFSRAFWGSLSPLRLFGGLALVGSIFRFRKLSALRDPVARLACSMVAAIALLSFFVIEPVLYQISPKGWLASKAFTSSVDISSRERLYSFGSEAYASSFYLKKPFYVVTSRPESGALVFLERRNLERFRSEIAPDAVEVARFNSGLEGEKKSLLVVKLP